MAPTTQTAPTIKGPPPEAFDFVRAGLEWTVRRIHGSPPKGWNKLVEWMQHQDVTLPDLSERYRRRRLPASILRLVKKLGGPEVLETRHVAGAQLCDGLRDLAVRKWGRMAFCVLRQWGIHTTRDFGRMVFTLIEIEELQKRADDTIEDFDNVFDFETSFVRNYRIPLPARL
ncbi:MAG: Minf_1886 family protein [Phycisphaerae bacterium]